jgi:hypothetical protein
MFICIISRFWFEIGLPELYVHWFTSRELYCLVRGFVLLRLMSRCSVAGACSRGWFTLSGFGVVSARTNVRSARKLPGEPVRKKQQHELYCNA